MPIPKTPCAATALRRDQPDQVISELRVIAFDLGTSNPWRIEPKIMVEAPHKLFLILNQQRPHLYVHDTNGNALTFVECTVVSGPSPILFKAMDVLDNAGKSIYAA